MIDLGRSNHGTYLSWPKCHRCSVRLQRPYPVETLEIEGDVEKPELVGSREKRIIVVECHGEMHRFALEVPRWWGPSMAMQSLGHVWAFVGVPGAYTVVSTAGRERKRDGSLLTLVR